jgi:antitoxin VapB
LIAPLVSFDEIARGEANRLLTDWGHKMGPCERGNERGLSYCLFEERKPVAVAMAMTLIAPNVGGGQSHMTRDNTIELARLCAARPGLCRVALRLWREFVFPRMDYQYAMSYQDSDIHTGNTYRFDGWKRVAWVRGTLDRRTDRQGRNRFIWVWERPSKIVVDLAA